MEKLFSEKRRIKILLILNVTISYYFSYYIKCYIKNIQEMK
ncbi:hypothetical protein BXY64_0267 [Marinifilum flexuosum]|uniref:Uncharacterized protein n=1 Tax=Marinifilum flexuosum TaxID=1117708 RepID=A0A419X693_9BACT|nr:hypothetical protein BXY64_0267 [Marinifilum flexuosum]